MNVRSYNVKDFILLTLLFLLCSCLLISAVFAFAENQISSKAKKATNMRVIGNSCLAYSGDHNGDLPTLNTQKGCHYNNSSEVFEALYRTGYLGGRCSVWHAFDTNQIDGNRLIKPQWSRDAIEDLRYTITYKNNGISYLSGLKYTNDKDLPLIMTQLNNKTKLFATNKDESGGYLDGKIYICHLDGTLVLHNVRRSGDVKLKLSNGNNTLIFPSDINKYDPKLKLLQP